MSRGHPGQSEIYQSKMATRNKREAERGFLQDAKVKFCQQNPEKDPKQFRSSITCIKKSLMAEF